MEHFEEKEVCKTEKTLIEITCDYCGRTLDKPLHWEGLALFSLKSRALEKISYFRTLSGHRDWGNNSIESREVKHICKDCIRQEFEVFLEEAEKTGTQFCRVEQMMGRIKKEG